MNKPTICFSSVSRFLYTASHFLFVCMVRQFFICVHSQSDNRSHLRVSSETRQASNSASPTLLSSDRDGASGGCSDSKLRATKHCGEEDRVSGHDELSVGPSALEHEQLHRVLRGRALYEVLVGSVRSARREPPRFARAMAVAIQRLSHEQQHWGTLRSSRASDGAGRRGGHVVGWSHALRESTVGARVQAEVRRRTALGALAES